MEVSTVGCELRAGLSACDDAERRARLPSPTRPPGPPSPVLRGDAKAGSSPMGSRDVTDLDVGAIFKECPYPHGTLGGPNAGAPEREGPFPLSPGGGPIQASGHVLGPGVGMGRTSIDSSSPVPVPGLAICPIRCGAGAPGAGCADEPQEAVNLLSYLGSKGPR